MTFIRGNKCIERDKDNFKSREVKRLKECALVLSLNPSSFYLQYLTLLSNFWNYFVWKKITDEGSVPENVQMVIVVKKIRFKMVYTS